MKNLETKYNHLEVEKNKYKFWLDGGFFEAGDNSKQPFSIVLPPPNVTGKLHLGHAWDTSIADMLVRRKRMQGYDTLWLPGMDHAGIATQARVDAKLKEQGLSRYDLGREKFLEEAWRWKHEYANHIRSQWEGLGLSLDYSKERFTLDEGMNNAVNHVFISLYNKGYIYQGERIINWDCEAKTALSNIEVEYKLDEGAFYHINYKIVNEDKYLTIATTRPETMFADQALMVHPEDERYKEFIGKKVIIPTTSIEIPVIEDSYVDKEFGTGVVKVTPAHDPNDFEVGKRHNLNMPLCMNEDGTMNKMAGIYVGQDRFTCRKNLVKDLENLGLLVKIEPMQHNVGHSERTGVVVEPRLSKQWFVKMEVLAKQVLENDEYRFVPERYKQVLERWLTNIQDWCISRQLWWGHRIPAWYKDDKVLVQVECPGEGYHQDEDVLDTWFSSALWPFATMGWPNNTELLERFYPTSVLVTGYDIIFFWVSRMLFEGIEFTNKAPFKDIVIHGLIRASDGRKMSKSLGNGVDPFDVIKKYGCDALRYFLNTNSAPGLDLRYDETKVESSWNYLNKIWNISRYVIMNLDDSIVDIDINKINLCDKFILHKLNTIIKEVDYNYDKYEFSEAARVLYNFIYNDFASWYVELSKVVLQGNDEEAKAQTKAVLNYLLMSIVKLLHPIVPFITEEIYQLLPHDEPSIMVSKWPTINELYNFKEEAKDVDTLIDVITTIRNLKAEAKKAPSAPINLILVANNPNLANSLNIFKPYLERFVKAKDIKILKEFKEDNYVIKVLENVTLFIPENCLVDREEVIKQLLEQKAKLEAELTRSEKMLNNPNFVNKAPKEKIESEQNKQKTYQLQYEEILKHLKDLGL